MAKKSKTFGLDPGKLADLLSIASDTDDGGAPLSAEEQKVELLLDRLGEPLLLDPSFVRLLPDVPHLLSNAIELCRGSTIEDLLVNNNVAVGLLRKVKDYNNKISQRATSRAERDVAIAIYYAAIASALVYHARRITAFDYSDLAKSFGKLKAKSWMSTDLADLFEKACTVCQDPSGVTDDIEES